MPEVTTRLLLDTLALGNRETYAFLAGARPSQAEIEAWILATSGAPDPDLVSRFNAWAEAGEPSAAAREQLGAIGAMPDALGPDDPASWYAAQTDGIMVGLYHHPLIGAARKAPRIHKAFAQLWGSADLWPVTDQLGFNPPERFGYAFRGSPLHWDVSLVRPLPFGTQGVLYLTDTATDQGEFRCVPGFHHRIEAWLDGLEGQDPRAVDLSAEAVCVPARAGDLAAGSAPRRQSQPCGNAPAGAISQLLFARHGGAARLAVIARHCVAAVLPRFSRDHARLRLTRCSNVGRAEGSSASGANPARAGERESPLPWIGVAAPKEQPPRKLSGHRTARLDDTLESASCRRAGGHRRGGWLSQGGPAEALRLPDRGGSFEAVP